MISLAHYYRQAAFWGLLYASRHPKPVRFLRKWVLATSTVPPIAARGGSKVITWSGLLGFLGLTGKEEEEDDEEKLKNSIRMSVIAFQVVDMRTSD